MHRFLTLLLLLLLSLNIGSAWAALVPNHLRCESGDDPLGIDSPEPRLSWTLDATEPGARGLRQSAYQVLVATERDKLLPDRADLWDSGKVQSDQMAHVIYAGKLLESNQQCWWIVRGWDQEGQVGGWSRLAKWQMGLLAAANWKAKWVRAPGSGDKSGPLPLFRKELELRPQVKRAVVHICGLGFYELSVNGTKVGDVVLDPGWTDYRKRCLYSTYDLTRYLSLSVAAVPKLALGVMLGNGMFNVRGGRYTKFTGSFGPPQFILQLHLEFLDGTSTNILSDSSWKSAPGPITFSCIYGGEDYDARHEKPGWDRVGFDDSAWQSAIETAGPGGRLVAQSAPAIKVMEDFEAQKVSEPAPGVFVYDLGRNFSGWPLLETRGRAGAVVKLIPGELLDERGLVSQRSSGGPTSFSYTLKGDGQPESWHPRFSYYGFRYLQVEGAVPLNHPESAEATLSSPAERNAPPPSDPARQRPVVIKLAGQFTHSSARRAGSFSCSEVLLGSIERIILAAIESNLQSVLTDCPHREKLGWLEVSHLLGPAIIFNYDVPRLYGKICDDMRDAQLPNGLVPDIAPEYTVFSGGFRDSPEWGSACVVNPWLIYERCGDPRPLSLQYDAMSRYVAYLGSKAKEHIVAHGLGDWYDIGPNPPGESQLTSKGLTATAIYYQDIEILRRAAELLGKKEDALQWARLAAAVKEAFNGRFFKPASGQYDRGSQTANSMPLVLGLVDPSRAPAVLDQLVRDVQARTNQVTAGDVGFRFLVEALRAGGRSDVLFDVVTRLQGPGYADQLRKGATTLTEAWDANPASSQNHCMLGHVEEWFYSGLGGINPDPAGPGFRKILIQPQVVRTMLWANAEYDSISGPIVSKWKRSGDQLTLEVFIPPNTSALVSVPTVDVSTVTESGRPAQLAPGVQFRRAEAGGVDYEVGSGQYVFGSRWR